MPRLVLMIGVLLASFGSAVQGAQADRPNVVVFLADDLGWGDLGCQGHPRIQTPNLDAFAKQGVRLTRCYSASAVCSPSRSAILTGRAPQRNGVFTWIAAGSELHLRSSEITLPKLLKAEGYATCHVGKWHLNGKFNDPSQSQPVDHGYDWWLGTQNNADPSHKNPTNFVRNGKPVGPLQGYSSILVVEEAIEWLKRHRDPAKPFFLAVWTHEPHLPIESAPEFQEPYRDLADPDLRQHHGDITQLDHAFGKLMKALDDQGLADTTFVAFTSDNGPEGDGTKERMRGSTGGLRGRKRSLYEGGIRVPGLVRWPGHIPPGSASDAPVVGTDLFSTILGIAGAKPPAGRALDGADILPILTGAAKDVERTKSLFWRLDMAPENLQMAFRQGDWKLLASRDLVKFELYNLKADPTESTNLKDVERERFQAMRAQLEARNAEMENEGPDWWKRLDPNGGGPRK